MDVWCVYSLAVQRNGCIVQENIWKRKGACSGMKKFTKISLIIAGVLGGIGIIFCGIARAFGGNLRGTDMKQILGKAGLYDEENGFHIGYISGINVDEDGIEIGNINVGNKFAYKGNESAQCSFAVEQVKNLEVDCDMADMTVVTEQNGTEIAVSMEGGYERFFTCEMEKNTLHITYSPEGINVSGGAEITISVPEGIQFDTVDIDCDMGKISAGQETISCNTLLLNCDMGDIDIYESQVKDLLKIYCSMGDCSFQGAADADIETDADMGNIDLAISGSFEDYNYSISCDMGNITVDGENYSNLSDKTNVENQGAGRNMELTCSMGNITVEFN
jgi:hypothetical protein